MCVYAYVYGYIYMYMYMDKDVQGGKMAQSPKEAKGSESHNLLCQRWCQAAHVLIVQCQMTAICGATAKSVAKRMNMSQHYACPFIPGIK